MIHIFLGTKAQLIKMAPVMVELQKRNIEYNFVFSGQHQATIQDIQNEFGIKKPDYTLYQGRDITGIVQMLLWSLRIFSHTLVHRKQVWKNDSNGIALNHGDTFSTLLGTIAAKACGLKSAHIESGLRSFNLFHPFPEELTRRLTFRLSDIFFAPGQWALDNLKAYKGIKVNTKYNTLIDALKISEKNINNANVILPNYKYGIVSIHRFENIFSRKKLLKIVELIEDIAQKQYLLMILHKPTLNKLKRYNLYQRLENNKKIELRPRYSYFQFMKLIKSAYFVVTDGGSNQEECYYLGKPCLILRQATERQEGIGHNACLSKFRIDLIKNFINNIDEFKQPGKIDRPSPTTIIIDELLSYSHM